MITVLNTYVTTDGKQFTTEAEAQAYENKLSLALVKIYKIEAEPDIEGGTYVKQFKGYIFVHADDKHILFAEDWAYKRYGNRIAFVKNFEGNDVFSSNNITENWSITEITTPIIAIPTNQVLDKIEEEYLADERLWS